MRAIFRDDHEIFREQARRFIEREILPYHAQWEKDGIVPRALWLAAGEQGLLCSRVPEAYGGAGGDFGHAAVLIEELARVNATGVGFTTHSEICAPYLVAYGTEAQKSAWLPGFCRGTDICAIAMTEPGAGSDLRGMRTTAIRDGDHYVLNGQKTFISNGMNATMAIVVAKTSADPDGRKLTLFCVDTSAPGFSKGHKLEKIGLHAQDTCEFFMDDVRVPVDNRLGDEHRGFDYLTHELAKERMIIAIRAAQSVESLIAETLEHVKSRRMFGKTLWDHQNTRFVLADAQARAVMLRAFVDACLEQVFEDRLSPSLAAMAKLQGAEIQNQVLDDLLQLYGGYGFMTEYRIARAWVDARVARIYGGASEVMREIIARSL